MNESTESSATLSKALQFLSTHLTRKDPAPMYGDVTLLLVGSNWQEMDSICQALISKRFQILRASSMLEATALCRDADILCMWLDLPNGHGMELLQYWVECKQGEPSCVLVGSACPSEEEINNMLQLAWHVVRRPYQPWQVRLITERMSLVVRGARWAEEVIKLRRKVTMLTIAVVALAAKEIGWPLLEGLISLIGG